MLDFFGSVFDVLQRGIAVVTVVLIGQTLCWRASVLNGSLRRRGQLLATAVPTRVLPTVAAKPTRGRRALLPSIERTVAPKAIPRIMNGAGGL